MVELGKDLKNMMVLRTTLNRESTLADSVQRLFGSQDLSNPVAPA